MFWRILPHASVCAASGDLVLLDIRQDRYFLVPPALTEPLSVWLHQTVPAPIPDAVGALLAQSGIARPADPAPTNVDREHIIVSDGFPGPSDHDARVSMFDITKIGSIVAATWLDLRLRPLELLLERRRRTSVTAACDPVTLLPGAQTFDRLRRFTPIARSCLLDSLALDRWLGRTAGYRLVFGVTAKPFAAHCWLQTEDAVLNDSYDRVSRYMPILAL
jgi:hypothetical protein